MQDWHHVAIELGYQSEKEMWNSLYETRTILQLARAFKCGSTTINRRLRLNGVSMRTAGGPNHDLGHVRRLMLIDPRILWRRGVKEVAEMMGVHENTVHRLKVTLRRIPE